MCFCKTCLIWMMSINKYHWLNANKYHINKSHILLMSASYFKYSLSFLLLSQLLRWIFSHGLPGYVLGCLESLQSSGSKKKKMEEHHTPAPDIRRSCTGSDNALSCAPCWKAGDSLCESPIHYWCPWFSFHESPGSIVGLFLPRRCVIIPKVGK